MADRKLIVIIASAREVGALIPTLVARGHRATIAGRTGSVRRRGHVAVLSAVDHTHVEELLTIVRNHRQSTGDSVSGDLGAMVTFVVECDRTETV